MTLFFRRFIGALVLDAGTFEDIEQDRSAGGQSVLVVAAVSIAGAIAAMGLGLVDLGGVVIAAVITLGGWLVWAGMTTALGTIAFADDETSSDLSELLRVLGFAAAPGVFIVLAGIRPAAPAIVPIVVLWMMATSVLGIRQAFDYHGTGRALAVCAAGWVVSAGILAIVAGLLMETVY